MQTKKGRGTQNTEQNRHKQRSRGKGRGRKPYLAGEVAAAAAVEEAAAEAGELGPAPAPIGFTAALSCDRDIARKRSSASEGLGSSSAERRNAHPALRSALVHELSSCAIAYHPIPSHPFRHSTATAQLSQSQNRRGEGGGGGGWGVGAYVECEVQTEVVRALGFGTVNAQNTHHRLFGRLHSLYHHHSTAVSESEGATVRFATQSAHSRAGHSTYLARSVRRNACDGAARRQTRGGRRGAALDVLRVFGVGFGQRLLAIRA
jgi:hypothetical protein